jgi:ferredoxin-type protein NapH
MGCQYSIMYTYPLGDIHAIQEEFLGKRREYEFVKRQSIRRTILLISFLLFPITIYYFSPVLVIQGASQGVVVGSLILFGLMFLSSLFLGRGFCGWACPAGGLQECCTLAVDKKASGGKFNLIKYIIWVPWVLTIIIFAFLAGGFNSVDFFYQIKDGISVSDKFGYIIYYFFVGLIALLALAGGKRAFCHYVCWMAPFMVIGSKINSILPIPSLRILPIKENCKRCKSCEGKCPMSLSVSTMVQQDSMENSECILCGQCVDTCTKGAVKFSFGLPKR